MKWIFKFSLMMLIQISAFGQTPEKISYQAVIRDSNGVLIENSNVNLKIALRQGSPNGATVYEETHNKMTNKNGLLSIEIGSGHINKGHFNEINWSKGPFFIESHVDPKGNLNYNLNGVSQLLSVPYALHAKSADFFTGTISPSQLPDFYTADEIDAIFLDIATERTPISNFSGDYSDLVNKPVLFSGRYSELEDKPELYNKTEIDNLIQGIETTGGSPQNLNLENNTLYISGGNTVSFENWDTNAADDFSGSYDDLQNKPILFSGQYSDLQNKPELYNKTEIDNLIQGIETTGGSPQNLNLDGETVSISGGNSISFLNWDTNSADDFSGSYDDLQNKPILFSGQYSDLQNKPELYNKAEIDNLLQSIETTGSSPQNLNLDGETLSISGGNSISFLNWDTNSADDFSGVYDDLQNKPILFSGQYSDLQNKPELYNKAEIDNLLQSIETTGSSPQNLNLDGETLSISGGNSISFLNWDTNSADDFSGVYDDLQNKPELYNKAEIDNLLQSIETTGSSPQNLNLDGETLSISGGNSISFLNWDTNSADDFSGVYDDLQNKPQLYNKAEIDNLLQNIETTGGSPQNLNLDGETLSISGGNYISFLNWDTNSADDFSGVYDDLQNKPELYNKTEIDNLIQGIETTGGSPQNLNLDGETLSISGGNSISFLNWDTNSADDFSGSYDDLQNKPILFSGQYSDLQNKPELYNKAEIDNLLQSIETTGSSPQNLNLDGETLSISGGNSISFLNWDTNSADDFSGSYDDLQNKPILFSGQYSDLQNKPELYNKAEIDNLLQSIETTGSSPQNLNLDGETLSISGGNSISFLNWDTNSADDFSGSYDDLQNKPELYNKTEIDNLLQSIETTWSSPQNLNLDGETLSISGGNSISFLNWDTNSADDFSGSYDDLQNKPILFSGQYADLQNKPTLFSGQYSDLQNKPELYNKAEIDNLFETIETTIASPKNLNLEGETLSISDGNSISFLNWDTNAADDFDGDYTSLTGAPKIYTQDEVNAIKTEILVHVKENYSPKAQVVSLSSSRNAMTTDVGNTLACISSATLNITSEFLGMQVGDVINLEIHGTTLTVTGGTGVVINGVSGGTKSIGNNEVYTGGLIRKVSNNSYIVL